MTRTVRLGRIAGIELGSSWTRPVRDVMSRRLVAVPAEATIAAFVDELAGASCFATYPVAVDGRPAGLLPYEPASRIPRSSGRRGASAM